MNKIQSGKSFEMIHGFLWQQEDVGEQLVVSHCK